MHHRKCGVGTAVILFPMCLIDLHKMVAFSDGPHTDLFQNLFYKGENVKSVFTIYIDEMVYFKCENVPSNNATISYS